MSISRQFTDVAGRTFYYSEGRRVYVDGGEDTGTPVPFKPERYPPREPRLIAPPESPSTGLLLENEKLSSMLLKYLGIRIPVEVLLRHENSADLLDIVLPLIPEPGATYEDRRALEDKVSRMGQASYRWAKHRVICSFACITCGGRLGAEGLRLATERLLNSLKELHKNHPGLLISVHRNTHAICSRCGSRYIYTNERNLVHVEDLDA